MKLSAILEPMIAAGVPGDVILATVKAFEEQQSDALERRRANDRERQERRRHVKSRDVTVTVSSCEGVTRGEDNLQTKKISGQEEKKDTSPPARSKRGERIPENFSPDIEAAVSEGLSRPEAERQARSFCDYWRSKPGKDGLKLDWHATWRVWYRRNLSRPPSHRTADPPHRMDRVNEILDQIQGKSNVPQHSGPSIDGSVERTDWGGPPNLVQLHAVSARGRS